MTGCVREVGRNDVCDLGVGRPGKRLPLDELAQRDALARATQAFAQLQQHGVQRVEDDHCVVLETSIEVCPLNRMVIEVDLEDVSAQLSVVLAVRPVGPWIDMAHRSATQNAPGDAAELGHTGEHAQVNVPELESPTHGHGGAVDIARKP